jgi:hypothetical protein
MFLVSQGHRYYSKPFQLLCFQQLVLGVDWQALLAAAYSAGLPPGPILRRPKNSPSKPFVLHQLVLLERLMLLVSQGHRYYSKPLQLLCFQQIVLATD